LVVARGDLDRLARSVARLAQRSMVLSLVEDEAAPDARCRRIGPALFFERLWHEVGCRAVLAELAAERPVQLVGPFNGFAKSVILRINKARDQGSPIMIRVHVRRIFLLQLGGGISRKAKPAKFRAAGSGAAPGPTRSKA
jgi:hypothetical protein